MLNRQLRLSLDEATRQMELKVQEHQGEVQELTKRLDVVEADKK